MIVMCTVIAVDSVEEKIPAEERAPVPGAFSSRELLISTSGRPMCPVYDDTCEFTRLARHFSEGGMAQHGRHATNAPFWNACHRGEPTITRTGLGQRRLANDMNVTFMLSRAGHRGVP